MKYISQSDRMIALQGENAVLKEQLDKQQSDIVFIAMMSDIDLGGSTDE